MNKKETDKILNSLMAFYQVVCNLHEGLEKVEDMEIHGILLKEHIFQLLVHHKQFTDTYHVGLPKLNGTYKTYCDEYNKKVMASEHILQKLIDNTKNVKKLKDDDLGYII